MEEIATLVIRVKGEDADKAKAKLAGLGLTAKETETATGGLMAKWKAFGSIISGVAGLAGIGAAVAGLRKLVDTAKQFESLEAQLRTATGSAEGAKIAFSALQDFARETPYDLAQTVEAFIKLTNLGLTPSERAMKSYGDTASALGKNLSEMVQAVARSIAGEYEPLKSFGVQARKETDGIVFTFQGTSTKVKNTAEEIEGYFIKLGETKFAGAMLERMATLEGKLSNLGDSWDILFATIAKAGAGDVIKKGIDVAIGAIEELTAMIASGQLGGYIDAFTSRFEGMARDVEDSFRIVSDVLTSVFGDWQNEALKAVSFIGKCYLDLPANIRAAMRLVGATFGVWTEYAEAAGSMVYNTLAGYLHLLVTTSENIGKEIWSHLKPGASEFDYLKAEQDAIAEFGKRTKVSWEETVASIESASVAYQGNIVQIARERNATVDSFGNKIAAAEALRTVYDRLAEARKKANEGVDRLAGFKVKGGENTSAEFDAMVKGLRTQSQIIQDTFDKRTLLIEENTRSTAELLATNTATYGSESGRLAAQQADALLGLRVKYEEERKLIQTSLKDNASARQEALSAATTQYSKDVAAVKVSGEKKAQEIKDQFANEREIIIQNTSENGKLRLELLARNEAEYAEARKNLLDKISPDVAFEADFVADSNALKMAELASVHEKELAELAEFDRSRIILHEDYLRRKEALEERQAVAVTQLATSQSTAIKTKQFQLYAEVLGMSSNIAGQLETIAEKSGKGAKAAFYAAKAIAVAQAIVATELAAMQAMADPTMTNIFGKIAASTAIRTLGYASVGLMVGTTIAGYEHGGMIPAGKYGLVGETGKPELVAGPAVVTSARTTADMGRAPGGNSTQVIVNNHSGGQVETSEREEPDGTRVIEILVSRVQQQMAGDVARGVGPFVKALQGAYPLRRGMIG